MNRRRTAASAALLVVASSFVAVGGSAPASGLPGTCERTWVHNDGTPQNWETPTNWNPIGIPGSTPGEVICISTTDTVEIDSNGDRFFHVDEVHLDGATALEVGEGVGLYVDGVAESVWGPGTSVAVTKSQLGGSGTIRAQGEVIFTSGDTAATFLSSTETDQGGDQPPVDPAGRGELVIEGDATLGNLGLALYTGYQVTIATDGIFSLAPNAFVAADYGTGLTIEPGGTLDMNGDGDYHQGFAVAGQPLNTLTNHGLLTKSAGSGTSVVDATYSGSGQVSVLAGTLALPDNQQVGASVAPGTSLATGRCEGIGASCEATVDPLKDEMSVAFTVPGANFGPATVQLDELGPVGPGVDPAGIGDEVLAHAEGLTGQAARIDLRFSQPDVMATPLHEVQVMHVTDAGPVNQVIDCVGGAVPVGHDSCVLRPVTRSADNTFVTVLTKTTSRWRLRRGQAVEPPAPTAAASAPQGLTVKEAPPFDGSVLAVAWSAPASSGTAPVTSYRVALDGQAAATPVGTSVVLKNPGPGAHKISVAALSTAGQGAEAVATVTVAALSKPRQVDDVRGAAGGKLTAGAKWKPPAEAGGFSVTKYKVAVFTSKGKKIATEVVAAGKRTYLFKLEPGRYIFKVRARNTDRWGPWSKPTDLVRPR